MVTLFIIITNFILFQFCVNVSTQICKGKNGTCCYGYKWDFAHNECILCEHGFIGINCDTKCRYPTYGQYCQSECKCDVPDCHHVNGCLKYSRKYMVESTLHIISKTTTNRLIEKENVSSDKRISNATADTKRNLTNLLRKTKETKHEMINTIIFCMIGLAAVSFIIYMIYIYTLTLEKRLVYTALI